MTKRKEERRELLKEDEFHSLLERAARYIQQNSGRVITMAVVVLGLLGAFFMGIAWLDGQRDGQAQSLYQAEKILETDINDEKAELKFSSDKEKNEAALKELDAVIASNSGVVKQQALVHKVGILVNLGRQNEVETLYKDIVAKDEGLKAFGLMGLGDYYLAEGRYADARAQYDKLESIRGLEIKDLIRYKRATSFKEEGQLDSARGELSQIVDAYEASDEPGDKPPIFTKAQTMLDELKADGEDKES